MFIHIFYYKAFRQFLAVIKFAKKKVGQHKTILSLFWAIQGIIKRILYGL